MFDWARGSVLKRMINAKIPFASYEPWLKGWAAAWPIVLLKIPKDTKIIDIGSGNYPYYAKYFSQKGCETHVLDGKFVTRKDSAGGGISKKTIKKYPEITFHLGLAGQRVAPRRYFDLITCISVMEHIYDSRSPMDPKNPMPHLEALADMIEMLKPGGILVLTYDFFLNDMPHWRGWDYLADIALLQQAGIPLLNQNIPLKSRTYIYNHEDTLFMAPEGILSFSERYLRSTSIGMIFKKPGGQGKIKYSPHPDFPDLAVGESFNFPDQMLAVNLKSVSILKTRKVIKSYINKLKKAL